MFIVIPDMRQATIQSHKSVTVIICVHGDTLLEMMLNQILASTVKSCMDIPLLVIAQETSLPRHKMLVVQVLGSYPIAQKSTISIFRSTYTLFTCFIPKYTSFSSIFKTRFKRVTVLRFAKKSFMHCSLEMQGYRKKHIYSIAASLSKNSGNFSSTL